MSNPLTGDCGAVLQISGSTIGRLVAALHQNDRADAARPSLPHAASLRLGDPSPIGGVRGWAAAQIGVPRVELHHASSDRVTLAFDIRARFVADAGSTAFPAFIHGTVHADYALQDVDPNCPGWSRRAAEVLWFRVVPGSVRFDGTAVDDVRAEILIAGGATGGLPDATVRAAIVQQIEALLMTRFEASPHPVGAAFRRGSLRSLRPDPSTSVVALAVPVGGAPAGNVATVGQVFVGGADLALAVSVDVVMAQLRANLAPLGAISATVKVHVGTPWPAPDIDTVYRVSVDPPVATWLPAGATAIVRVELKGRAKTDSVLPDADFDIRQDVVVGFDAGAGRLVLWRGSSSVKVHSSGLGSGEVAGAVSSSIVKMLPGIVDGAIATAQKQLDGMTDQLAPLEQQLRTLDAAAGAEWTDARFGPHGVVLEGRVSLSSRRGPVVRFAKTPARDGFDAFEAWIPGGRIDRFEWNWSWGARSDSPPGTARLADRTLLRRPRGRPSRWGVFALEQPLPGLDGGGSLCLRVVGVQVDAATGQLVPVRSTLVCKSFSNFVTSSVVGWSKSLALRDLMDHRPDLEVATLVRTGAARADAAGSNALVVFPGREWNSADRATLLEGLARCRRYDAGLVVLLLLDEGSDEGAVRRFEAEALAREAGIGVHADIDVDGAWARHAEVGPQERPAWRLLGTAGSVRWKADGRLEGAALAVALDVALQTSADPVPASRSEPAWLGARLSPWMLHLAYREIESRRSRCPPRPFGRTAAEAVRVAFVHRSQLSGTAMLERMLSDRDEAGSVVAVVTGLDAREADELGRRFGPELLVVADPSGELADRFRLAAWPSVVDVDATGRVVAVRSGVGEVLGPMDDRAAAT